MGDEDVDGSIGDPEDGDDDADEGLEGDDADDADGDEAAEDGDGGDDDVIDPDADDASTYAYAAGDGEEKSQYQAKCSCGWEGQVTDDYVTAADEAFEHNGDDPEHDANVGSPGRLKTSPSTTEYYQAQCDGSDNWKGTVVETELEAANQGEEHKARTGHDYDIETVAAVT